MSDHEVGAHEVDQMSTGRLFNLLVGLSIITLLACVAVVQLFYAQVRALVATRGENLYSLQEYRKEMDGVVSKEGDWEFSVGTANVKVHYIPLEEAEAAVLRDPKTQFVAAPAMPNWDRAAAVREFESGATVAATAATPSDETPPTEAVGEAAPTPDAAAGESTEPTTTDAAAPSVEEAAAAVEPPAAEAEPTSPTREAAPQPKTPEPDPAAPAKTEETAAVEPAADDPAPEQAATPSAEASPEAVTAAPKADEPKADEAPPAATEAPPAEAHPE